MNLKQRIDLMVELGNFIASESPEWQAAKERAHGENGWFSMEFIDQAVRQIRRNFLQKDALMSWAEQYQVPAFQASPKMVGVVMAGNIPLVGFHDFLTVFISGHRQRIKPSSRDESLIKTLAQRAMTLDRQAAHFIEFSVRLNGCDAYIATGSNNSARYFDYYFGPYPHVIRRNRTSVAILNGKETKEELEKLADDVYLYFGLGCRNVTKLYIPEKYDFIPLLEAFKKYHYLVDYAKYKHNYDYQLTILLLNRKFYMTNGSILLAENPSPFSPISVLNYEFYSPEAPLLSSLSGHPDIQCIVGQGQTPFGLAQQPGLNDYADGLDTLQFLRGL
jgi:hypothetical protein